MPDFKTGSIQINGLSELEKRLEDFPDKIARNILAGAIRAGASVIRKAAQANAPKSGKVHKLGKGSKAIEIQPGSLKKGIKIRLAPRKSRERPIEYWVYVQRRLWYWKFIEFGTSKMQMKPFMRPAFDVEKEAATDAVKEYLAQRIDKEAAKNGN